MKLESFFLRKVKDYSRYPFLNLFLYSMEGEEWKDAPQFDGYCKVSSFGRVWTLSRPIDSITGQHYHTKERIRTQTMLKTYNSYIKEYTEDLYVKIRYERIDHTIRVNRLVYECFVGPLDADPDRRLVVHKDGDNCNNRFDNLVLMNGSESYAHHANLKRVRRAKRIIRRAASLLSQQRATRAIVQYTLAGERLNEYESVAEAALANKVHTSSVRWVAQQRLIQLHGLVYRFKGIEYHGEHAGFSYEKQVTQYAPDGKKIRVFPSVKDAALTIGADPNTVSKCALHKLKTCCGFVWRYDGDPYNGEYKDQIKNKPLAIVQYSLDGTRVARYASVNEATRITGYTSSTLLDSAHKRTKVAHGFVWRFQDEPYTGEYKAFRKGKPVTQYSREGNKIETYPTIETAAKATGLTPDNIQKNVNGHNKTAGGFVWKFASPEEVEKIPFTPLKYEALTTGKEVTQYTVEGKKLGAFASITAAAKACKTSAGGISAVLNIPGRTAAGFVWRTEGNSYGGEIAEAPAANKAHTVTQYDMDGVKLNVFRSTRQACQITGVDSSTISFVARGKLKSTGGFIWRYGDGPGQIDVNEHYASSRAYRESVSKPVLKYAPSGEFIKEYPSIAAAAREEGIRIQAISSVVNGQRTSTGGNVWTLKTDDGDLK